MTTIDVSLKFDELTLVNHLKKINSPFINTVTAVYNEVKSPLDDRIPAIFPKYTLHNTGHSFRIINYMAQIIDDYKVLSDLEITLLICAALLHDVGMAVAESDVLLIKKDAFPFANFKYSAMLRLMHGDEILAMQEFIRRIHAELSAKFIREKLKTILVIPNLSHLDYSEELALICESHTRDFDWIKSRLRSYEVRGDYVFNPQFISCLLRLGDILDIDGQRTPYKLYQLIAPVGISDEEWRQHFVILNNDKISINEKTHLRSVVFHGKSTNADIHRKILTYIDWVENELVNSIALTTPMRNEYNLPFEEKPRVSIQTENYTFSGYKMILKFEAISSLLMGEKIYGDRSLGLRELIQNSLDACRIRQENDAKKFGEDPYEPKIKVILDGAKNEVIIRDNGIGMSIDIIKKHFLNIGVSYYRSFDFLLKDLKYRPIGNYGIGFLSCFMFSNKVIVKTRHYESKSVYIIQLEKGLEWTSLTETEDINFFGTEVILDYKHFMSAFQNQHSNVAAFLKKYFLTDGIDFKLIEFPETQSQIANQIHDPGPIEKGYIRLPLSDYLEDVEGYAVVKRKTGFITSLSQLSLSDQVYLYNPTPASDDDDEENEELLSDLTEREWLLKVDNLNDINIDDYVVGDQIAYLSLPIIDYSVHDEFDNGMKFTNDDLSEVLDKLEHKLSDWVTILVPKAYQRHLEGGRVEWDEEILPNLYLRDLEIAGHLEDYPTYINVEKELIYEGEKNRLYLPFVNGNLRPWFWPRSPRIELFIRGVLIKDFRFEFPQFASVFELSDIVINVKSRKFIPDVSRNNIDSSSGLQLTYMISKAIHLAAVDHLDFEIDEQKTLRGFLDKFYGRDEASLSSLSSKFSLSEIVSF